MPRGLLSEAFSALTFRGLQYTRSLGLHPSIPCMRMVTGVFALLLAPLCTGAVSTAVGMGGREALHEFDAARHGATIALILSSWLGCTTLIKLQSVGNAHDLLSDPYKGLLQAAGLTPQGAWLGLRMIPLIWKFALVGISAPLFAQRALPHAQAAFIGAFWLSGGLWLSASLGASILRLHDECHAEERPRRTALLVTVGCTAAFFVTLKGLDLASDSVCRRDLSEARLLTAPPLGPSILIGALLGTGAVCTGLGGIRRFHAISFSPGRFSLGVHPRTPLSRGRPSRGWRFLVTRSARGLPSLAPFRNRTLCYAGAAVGLSIATTLTGRLPHPCLSFVSHDKLEWATLGMPCAVSWFTTTEICERAGARAKWGIFRLVLDSGVPAWRIGHGYLIGLAAPAVTASISWTTLMVLFLDPFFGMPPSPDVIIKGCALSLAGVAVAVLTEALLAAHGEGDGVKRFEPSEPIVGMLAVSALTLIATTQPALSVVGAAAATWCAGAVTFSRFALARRFT